jgi:hypothetical protein
MDLFLFILGLLYTCFIAYHIIRGTVPGWIETRLYHLRTDPSFKDLTSKRWDTPVGALHKTFSLSVLFTSFIVLIYLVGWERLMKTNMLLLAVVLTAIAFTYLIQLNFCRRLRYHHEKTLRNKQENN